MATMIHKIPPRANGRHPASLTAVRELLIPTAAIAIVIPKWARNFKGSVQELGMTPMDCIAAATINSTKKGGISRYQTVVFRCSGGSCLFWNQVWKRAKGTMDSVRVNFTTTA